MQIANTSIGARLAKTLSGVESNEIKATLVSALVIAAVATIAVLLRRKS